MSVNFVSEVYHTLQGSLACRKTLRHVAEGFTSLPKGPSVPTGLDAGWAWTQRLQETSCTSAGDRTQVVCVVRHYTDRAIPAPSVRNIVSKLIINYYNLIFVYWHCPGLFKHIWNSRIFLARFSCPAGKSNERLQSMVSFLCLWKVFAVRGLTPLAPSPLPTPGSLMLAYQRQSLVLTQQWSKCELCGGRSDTRAVSLRAGCFGFPRSVPYSPVAATEACVCVFIGLTLVTLL
jgi:hypothetical protein